MRPQRRCSGSATPRRPHSLPSPSWRFTPVAGPALCLPGQVELPVLGALVVAPPLVPGEPGHGTGAVIPGVTDADARGITARSGRIEGIAFTHALCGHIGAGPTAGSPTRPVARASLSFTGPARTPGSEAVRHLAVEVKALPGALTGWDNAVVMPPRCDVCLPDPAGVGEAVQRGSAAGAPAAAAVADDCGRRGPRMASPKPPAP
jgi:hypothetical protein